MPAVRNWRDHFENKNQGTWVAQWVEHPTPDFRSSPDLRGDGALHQARVCLKFSLLLPLPLMPVLFLSLK